MRSKLIQLSHIFTILATVGLLLGSAPVMAADAKPKAADKKAATAEKKEPTDISGAVSQSYNADKAVQTSMIVKLKEKSPDTVIALDSKNPKSMLGVVIPTSGTPLVLAPQTPKEQQVLVATSGRHSVLVSNQNGPIKVGDYVAISAVDGVGMKAGEEQDQVLGKAAGTFTGRANVVGTLKVKDTTGKDVPVSLGRINVDINVSNNPLFQKTTDYVPGFLSSVAITVAAKPVSVARIYLCTAILFITLILASNMLYSGIRGGMMAVGRNPLSKKSIIKSLIETVMAGLIVFVVGVFAVYLILKL